MQLIRCTAKLRKEMGLKKDDLVEESPRFSLLGQWHANLVYVNRRKCILFVNDMTLFNFMAADMPRSEIRNLGDMFRLFLRSVLSEEGLGEEALAKVLGEYSEIRFGKSNDRSVLGSINDLAYHYEFSILESGGVQSAAIPSIIKKLNPMPMNKKGGCIWPAEELRKLYESATWQGAPARRPKARSARLGPPLSAA